MNRRPTTFRHEPRPPALRPPPESRLPDAERRLAYLAVGLAAAVAQVILLLLRGPGVSPVGHIVGILASVGLGVASYRQWLPIRGINGLVAYGNSVWAILKLLFVLSGRWPFDLSLCAINSLAVFIAMSWLPARQAVPISVLLTGLLVGAVARFAPLELHLSAWTVFLNIMFVFMTYYGQRISDASMREELLEKLAFTDPLTGALNRRGGWLHLEDLMRAQAGAVILADVDNFKRINDQHGHAVGDEVLRAIASTLSGPARHAVARWGGEEFLILLPGATRAQAEAVAEQVLLEMRGLQIGVISAVSLSLGVAAVQETADPDHLIALADQRMYAAKQAGGDAWSST